MTSPIQSLPSRPDTMGLQFDYSVWSPGTEVTFCNVPWDQTYRDIVWYADTQSCINDITRDGAYAQITKMTYCAVGRPIRVDIPFSEANRYNYLVVRNPRMPLKEFNRENVFFYFITSVDYIAPNTTQITVQLDVWQTYCHDIKIGKCYVTRGHIGIAAVDAFDDNGQTYLTTPEGLEIGGDYVVNNALPVDILSKRTSVLGKQNTKASDDVKKSLGVLIVSTIELDGDYGSQSNPKFKTAHGGFGEGLPNGASQYYCSLEDYQRLMSDLSIYPWAAQGIISVTIVPADAVNDELASWGVTKHTGVRKLFTGNINTTKEVTLLEEDEVYKHFNYAHIFGGRYKHLKKFLTYPYAAFEFTAYTGQPIIVKPEMIKSASLHAERLMHVVPPAPRIQWVLKDVNVARKWSTKNDGSAKTTSGEYLDMSVGMVNLPTFSIVNDSYMQYMASNANGISFQYQTADWSQQKATMAATNSRAIASSSMNAQAANGDLSRRQASAATAMSNAQRDTMTQYNGVKGAATGALGNLMSGNIGGAFSSVVGNAASTGADYFIGNQLQNSYDSAMTAMSNATSEQMMGNSLGAAKFAADTNYDYAMKAANGDYANTIAGINAKTQDAKMLQPGVSGQVGGDAFLLATSGWALHCKWKSIPEGAIRGIGEYWLRFGYAMNVFTTLPDNFQVMNHFTYWECKETTVTSSTCPETFRQTIRGIFEKGVTVWADKRYIGNIDYADNAPLSNIRISTVVRNSEIKE